MYQASRGSDDKNSGIVLTKLLAGVSAAMATCGDAEAVDFFNSGPITSNNTVGVISGIYQQASFAFELKSGPVNLLGGAGGSATLAVVFGAYGSNPQNFKVAIYNRPNGGGAFTLSNAGQLFGQNATWGQRNGSGDFGWGGFLYTQFASGTRQFTTFGRVNPAATDKYLLFKFTDNSTDYFGWVKVDLANFWDASLGTTYVTVKEYAWQSGGLGIIQAGATAVPEPSTVVTGGIAALAGGAMALRRWRKERKAKNEAA
ncbi:hypothetical protein GC170_08315 [bacterium]|nr:hypothetical protein [bacterium]